MLRQLFQFVDAERQFVFDEAEDFDAVSGCVDDRDGTVVAVVAFWGGCYEAKDC
jgi:hypothetical protein